MTDHAGALQHLHGSELLRHTFHGCVQLLDAGDRVDLGDLAGHLGVVHGVHRILVVELRNQKFHEPVGLLLRADSARIGRCSSGCAAADGGSHVIFPCAY